MRTFVEASRHWPDRLAVVVWGVSQRQYVRKRNYASTSVPFKTASSLGDDSAEGKEGGEDKTSAENDEKPARISLLLVFFPPLLAKLRTKQKPALTAFFRVQH